MTNKDVKETKKAKVTKENKKEKKVKESVSKEESKNVEKTAETNNLKATTHVEGYTNKKSSKYKKLIEKYKKRNRIVEVVIACIVLVLIFILACNKTFLKTNYEKKVDNSVINIDLPMFTYYVDSDDEKIIFKTLRKSSNTRAYFDEFLRSSEFDLYYCGDNETYYYNSEGRYFIYDIEVEKKFVVKTVTINYSTADVNSFCDTVKNKA